MNIEKIGIIGIGVVGSAVSHGIGRLGFEVVQYSISEIPRLYLYVFLRHHCRMENATLP